MTATAQHTEELRELDADTARAWREYIERLRELTGEEYDRAEGDSWAELQDTLNELERRRETLNRESS